MMKSLKEDSCSLIFPMQILEKLVSIRERIVKDGMECPDDYEDFLKYFRII